MQANTYALGQDVHGSAIYTRKQPECPVIMVYLLGRLLCDLCNCVFKEYLMTWENAYTVTVEKSRIQSCIDRNIPILLKKKKSALERKFPEG